MLLCTHQYPPIFWCASSWLFTLLPCHNQVSAPLLHPSQWLQEDGIHVQTSPSVASFRLVTPALPYIFALPRPRPSLQMLFTRRLHNSDVEFAVVTLASPLNLPTFRLLIPASTYEFVPPTLGRQLGAVFTHSLHSGMWTLCCNAGFTHQIPSSGTAYEWLEYYSRMGFTSRMRSLVIRCWIH